MSDMKGEYGRMVEVVDFHAHCFPDELARKAVPVLAKRAGVPPRVDGTLEGLKKSMAVSEVGYSVVLPIATKPSQTEIINTWSAEIQGEGIISFGSIHPGYEGWKDELLRLKELGLKGIKFHPDYQEFYVDEPRMFPIYELAFKLDFMVVFHAGVDIGLPEPYHCTPERLLKLVEAFPGGRIVAAHLGSYSYWDDVEQFLVGKDIYLDTSYTLGWIEDEQAIRIITEHGYEKILFGTDSPWTDQAEEIDKLLNLGLDKKMEDAILGGNAKSILGI